jgi:hypothetical protein
MKNSPHPEDGGSKFLRKFGIYLTTLRHIPEKSSLYFFSCQFMYLVMHLLPSLPLNVIFTNSLLPVFLFCPLFVHLFVYFFII